ncbi:MAG: lysylphosphatidylglycerol synthase domain-containing protein, partial [Cyanobacteria bacterium P01_E01_bin.34]
MPIAIAPQTVTFHLAQTADKSSNSPDAAFTPATCTHWPPIAMLTPKKVITSILSLGLGIFLLWLVLELTGVGLPEIVESLRDLNPFFALMVLVTTWLHLWLSAYKWKVISRRVAGEEAGARDFYMPYITFGAMLGQLMPQQLSMMAVQSFAMKFHGLSSLKTSVFAVIYDQIFNLLVPVLVIPPALLLAFNQTSEPIALFLTLMTLFIVPFLIRGWGQPAILGMVKFYIALKKHLFRQPPAVDLDT